MRRKLKPAWLALDLLRKRTAPPNQNGPRDGEQQRPVLFGHVVGSPQKDAARPVELVRAETGVNHCHDLVVERLLIRGRVFVEYDEVRRETPHSPEFVRVEQLPDEGQMLGLGDADEHDRNVARDAVGPQPGLSAPVSSDDIRSSAEIWVHVEQPRREPEVHLCLVA